MRKFLCVIFAAIVLISLASCGDEQNPSVDLPTPTLAVENTPTEAPATPTPVLFDALKLPTDLIEVKETLGWWDNFARFDSIVGDAVHTEGMHEGAGSEFFRRISRPSWQNNIKAIHEKGFKVGDWLECQGDSGAYIIALHQNEDGTFLMDETTGNAKVLANCWSWDNAGPGANPEANYVTWAGLFTFVNDEPWSPSSTTEALGMGKPTYPDGTVAIGYKEGDNSPAGSLFLDACAAKNINGRFIKLDGLEMVGTSKEGSWEYVDEFGRKYNATAISVGKDSCAPYWLEYAETAIREKISDGVDYFWIDNWNGWDNISNNPVERAFGTWSEYKFKLYVNENEKFGISDPDFSITAYLKEKALEFDPEASIEEIEFMLNHTAWDEEEWLDEPIWLAYLAFKSRANEEYSTKYYNLIKDIAEEINGDRESVAACANDFPYLTYGGFSYENLDLVHTEYNANYYACTGFTTSGYPPNGYNGHAYLLSAEMCRANNAVFWNYPADYGYTDTFTKVLGYEALAYNGSLNANITGIGTQDGNANVFGLIGKLRDTFADRQIYADIGVVYSAESELTWLAPGGYSTANETTVAYMGWCHLLDELNVPYRSIFEDRLAEKISLCSVVILPNIRSIAPEVVDQVLIPYLDSGKTLVITGEYAGKLSSIAHDFEKNESNILVDLANNYSGAGKVIYIEKDPAMNYFTHVKSYAPEIAIGKIPETVEMIQNWHGDGTATTLFAIPELKIEDSVVTTLHYAPSNNTYFLDIVNMQYDCDTDTLTPLPENMTATLRLPSQLWGMELKISVATSDKEEIIVLDATQFTINEAEVTINIPNFDVYSCVMITVA